MTLKFKILVFFTAALFAACTEDPPVLEGPEDIPDLPSDTISPDTGQADEPFTTDLLAGQTLKIGEVTVTIEESELVISYLMTDPEWLMVAAKLSVTSSLDEVPLTSTGNPKVGHFEYSGEYNPSTTEAFFRVPVAGRSSVVIAAYAEVITGEEEEGAWAAGENFPGSNWSSYFVFQIEE